MTWTPCLSRGPSVLHNPHLVRAYCTGVKIPETLFSSTRVEEPQICKAMKLQRRKEEVAKNSEKSRWVAAWWNDRTDHSQFWASFSGYVLYIPAPSSPCRRMINRLKYAVSRVTPLFSPGSPLDRRIRESCVCRTPYHQVPISRSHTLFPSSWLA